jgi:drug/metabolite transporter (DMT)-like permease
MSVWQWVGAILVVPAFLAIGTSLIIRHRQEEDWPEAAPAFIFGVLVLVLAVGYFTLPTEDAGTALLAQALIPTCAGLLLTGLIAHDKLFPDE